MGTLIKTYVEGFDDVLDGGIPEGQVVLIRGEAGTMKTSLAYSIMHHSASNDGLGGLYITLEQKKSSVVRQMEAMGFATEDAVKEMTVMDVAELRKESPMFTGDTWLDFLKRCVERRRQFGRIDIVTIDSLDALEALAGFDDRRIAMHSLFEWLRDCKFTTFLISEKGSRLVFENFDIAPQKNDEEYLADAIISLRMKPINEFDIQRRLRCVKMRGMNHDTGYFALMFEGSTFRVTKAIGA